MWQHYGRKVLFVSIPSDWIKQYPDLLEILKEAAKSNMIMLWPDNNVTDEDGYHPQEVTLKPPTLKLLKSRLREAHCQARRGPRKRLDPRNSKGALILYSSIHGLAINAKCWLNNLNDPFAKKANASERMLQDLVGLRYDDLKSEYPQLLEEIERALTAPRSCGV